MQTEMSLSIEELLEIISEEPYLPRLSQTLGAYDHLILSELKNNIKGLRRETFDNLRSRKKGN